MLKSKGLHTISIIGPMASIALFLFVHSPTTGLDCSTSTSLGWIRVSKLSARYGSHRGSLCFLEMQFAFEELSSIHLALSWTSRNWAQPTGIWVCFSGLKIELNSWRSNSNPDGKTMCFPDSTWYIVFWWIKLNFWKANRISEKKTMSLCGQCPLLHLAWFFTGPLQDNNHTIIW